ncbi:uncharacterized protein LOC127535962 [Acanthochromis polyacanthus]|uniref:uncharacterized protein LOC127535962 n=1 Tax=Acanthochromis polyacanthus TaxID=80966 RepID=UPI002234C22B|nr:uncharacterized protein LOC127535962 [Acanthochromis polyacanthus]
MPQYITDLEVSLNENDESHLRAQGFSKIDVDLNKGAKGNYIYLWYKTGSCGAITRIQFSFNEAMSEGLNRAGYQKINKDLNAGAGGDYIYLWFFKGSSEYHVPIVNLDVSITDEAQKFKFNWERLACDLNRGAGGCWIYLWVKRENPTYICDLTATSNFQGDDDYLKQGYIRVDEDTNRGAGGAYVFIWYRETTKYEGAIKSLQVSTDDAEYQRFQSQQYKPVNMNLNQGTKGTPVFLWYKKDDCSSGPIKDITLITRRDVSPFEAVGVEVIDKNFNAGVEGAAELLLCFYH